MILPLLLASGVAVADIHPVTLPTERMLVAYVADSTGERVTRRSTRDDVRLYKRTRSSVRAAPDAPTQVRRDRGQPGVRQIPDVQQIGVRAGINARHARTQVRRQFLNPDGRIDRIKLEGYGRTRQEPSMKKAQAAASEESSTATSAFVVSADDHVRGSLTADVSLIEYADFECPFCQRFHLTMLTVLDEYAGRVNVVYRPYPLSFHPHAYDAALAAECVADLAGDEALWEFSDLLYQQDHLNTSVFASLAKQVGADKTRYGKCMDNETFAARVDAIVAMGAEAGVTGTPNTIALNNHTGKYEWIQGAQPIENVKSTIDLLLAQ